MKICYIILTCEKFLPTRVEWQLSTCFKFTDKKDIYYLSCKNSGEYIYGWNTDDNYESCPIKYIEFFKNMTLNYDWYIFIDDDTFINTKNLNIFLNNFDPYLPYYIGVYSNDHLELITDNYRIVSDESKGTYTKYNGEIIKLYGASGGAGIIMSNNIYNNILKYVRNTNINELYFNLNGDVTLASWVNKMENIIYIQTKYLHTDKHKNEKELENFISFHYLKDKEDFEFYYSYII